MKTLWTSLGCALIFATGITAWAAPTTVQVAAEKKRISLTKPKPGGEGDQAKGTETVVYDIKLENRAPGDLTGLSIDYVVFVERQKLGEKKNVNNVVRVSGARKVETLAKQAPQTVTTDEIALITENLVGNYIFSDGGRIRAEDSIKGIWVRVSQNGQVVGEYLNPTTIRSRGWQ